MKNKFTPAPWKIGNAYGAIIAAPFCEVKNLLEATSESESYGGKLICESVIMDGSEERVANAKLIAAAPELLEALESFVTYHKKLKDIGKLNNTQKMDLLIEEMKIEEKANSVIKKARGE